MKLAIIPARGGSKRIPRKNIKFFHGKPIIAWSIEAAKNANIFERIIVTTDDEEIAECAMSYGAEVPFLRPSPLSDDFATTNDVIAHGVQWMLDHGQNPLEVCCIYATAPFLMPKDIERGLNILIDGDWEYVFSAVEFSAPVFRGFMKNPNLGLEMIFPEHYLTRSQDLPKVFHDAAQFYWAKTNTWLEKPPIFSSKSFFLEIPKQRVQDIDTLEDWDLAERMFELLKLNKNKI